MFDYINYNIIIYIITIFFNGFEVKQKISVINSF